MISLRHLVIFVIVLSFASLFEARRSLSDLSSLHSFYFLTNPNSSNVQYAGRYNLEKSDLVYFQKFITDNRTSIQMGIHDDSNVMMYAITNPPSRMYGFALNASITLLQIPFCTIPPYVSGNDYTIQSFNLNAGLATLLVTPVKQKDREPYQIQIYSIDLFPRGNTLNSPCNTRMLGNFYINVTHYNGTISNTILGASSNASINVTTVLHQTLGLIKLNYTTASPIRLSWTPPNPSFVPIIMSSQSDWTTGNMFIIQNVTIGSSDAMPCNPSLLSRDRVNAGVTTAVFSVNSSSLNATFLFNVPSSLIGVSNFGYDFNSGYFLFNTGNLLVILDSSGNQQISRVISDVWETMMYFPGNPNSFCPNGCSLHGGCVPGTGCQCRRGWSNSDCSICDSNVICNGHGICNSMGTCSCVQGWKTPQCSLCVSETLCSGHGTCSSTANGACTCDFGFGGANCSVCNSTQLCGQRGDCLSDGSCICHRFWTGTGCQHFQIPSVSMVNAIFILNVVALGIWVVMFLLGTLGIILNSSVFPAKFISYAGLQTSLIYFQSFALIMTNQQMIPLLGAIYSQFDWTILDVTSALTAENANFHEYADNSGWTDSNGISNWAFGWWTESACFFPKTILFILSLVTFKLIRNWKFRGIFIYLGITFYFGFVISLFLRFQQKCDGISCPHTYSIIATLLSIFCLVGLMIINYRIWKVITVNINYFTEDANNDRHLHWMGNKHKPVPMLARLLSMVFMPISEILNFFFTRLCDVKKKSRRDLNPDLPPITAEFETASRSSERSSTGNFDENSLSIEQYITEIGIKAHEDRENISRAISMLKGNWYTTVADLRNLSESDAEKLGISHRMFSVIRKELPEDPCPENYTPLENLIVQSDVRLKKDAKYRGILMEFNSSHVYFILDRIFLRNFIWSLLWISLWQYPVIQLGTILTFQIWYLGFLLWHRPYRYLADMVTTIFSEISLIIVLILLYDLSLNNSNYFFMLIASLIHVLVVIVCTGSRIFVDLWTKFRAIDILDRDEGKDSIKSPLLVRNISPADNFKNSPVRVSSVPGSPLRK